MNNNDKCFLFRYSYYEAAQLLPDEQRLALYDAIINYGLFGIKPEPSGVLAIEVAFILIKSDLDNNLEEDEEEISIDFNH